MKTKLLIFTSTLLYANAKIMPRNLNNQPHIIAGDSNHSVPEYYGDMPHAGAQGDSLAATTDILHEDLVNGLRSEFDFLRNSLTGSDDGDGFVREGIVFCGFTGVTDGNLTNIPASFSSKTESLVPEDGYGGTAALNIKEADYCKSNKCEEGSFVSTIVNRIRSVGYHVTHSDVCSAEAEDAWNEVVIPTCQMNGYTNTNTSAALVSYSYKAKGDGDAWLNDRKKCQKKKKKDCITSGTTPPDGCVWNSQQFCAPECAYSNSTDCANYYGGPVSSIAVDSTRQGGGSDPSTNEVRRETAYEDFIGEVVTDRIFVTGVENANKANNCKSLRQYVAALNGLAQINAFRDLGIMQGEAVWGALVEKLSQNFRGIAILLNDFHAMSMKMFPGIEFSEFDECPIGLTEHNSISEEGTETAPLCTKKKFNTNALLNAQGAVQQGILRHDCFCRQASSGYLKNADTPYLEWKQSRITDLCSGTALENNTIANKYVCEPRIGKDLNTWKSNLKNLEPKEYKIITYGTDAQKSDKTSALLAKIQATMNLVDDEMEIDCGRLVSTDNNTGTSNKGGNCIPFPEMNDILYKLEIMTSGLEHESTFFITDSKTTDVHFGRNTTAWNESASDNIAVAMKDIDSFSRTTSDEQVFEAALNVEIAMGLKRTVLDANEVTWLALREELTSLDTARIIHSVAEKAAQNFMRITTTDSDDPNVDSDDKDAVKDATENSTAMTGSA